MTVLGAAISQAWGECAWTARDMLAQPVKITMLTRPEPETRLVVVPILANGWLRT